MIGHSFKTEMVYNIEMKNKDKTLIEKVGHTDIGAPRTYLKYYKRNVLIGYLVDRVKEQV